LLILKKINSVFDLADIVEQKHLLNPQQKTIVLIGGCARVGKSTLSKELNQLLIKKKLKSLVIPLDLWLVSHNKRKPDSTVIDRFHTKIMIKSLIDLYNGQIIYPPLYDFVKRVQILETGHKPITYKSGILIIEGVIALALSELRKLASISIHLEINNRQRLKRLIEFYTETKKLPASECRRLIKEREKEEVPFINDKSKHADLIFNTK